MKTFWRWIFISTLLTVEGAVTNNSDGDDSSTVSILEGVGNTVWKCTKETLQSAVGMLATNTSKADQINCWYQGAYEKCLSNNLTSDTKQLTQFYKEVAGPCSNETVSTTYVKCLNDYLQHLDSFGCSKIKDGAQADVGNTIEYRELELAYCRFSEITEECIMRISRFCSDHGHKLVNDISSINTINMNCESDIPKTTPAVPPGETIDFTFPNFPATVDTTTVKDNPIDGAGLTLPNICLLVASCVLLIFYIVYV